MEEEYECWLHDNMPKHLLAQLTENREYNIKMRDEIIDALKAKVDEVESARHVDLLGEGNRDMTTHRRNRHGILRAIDGPLCCECKRDLHLPTGLFAEFDIDYASGAVEEVACQHCGHRQNLSPLIEWQTWDA